MRRSQRRTETPSCHLFDLVLDMNWSEVAQWAETHPIDATYQDGDLRESPIYLACQHNPPVEAIEALLAACPAAILWPSSNGDIPLLCACRYRASAEVIRLLVEADPASTRVVTKRSNTALMALCNSNEESELVRWHKLRIILEGVARSQDLVSDSGDLLLVHAAVSLGGLGCPVKVVDYVISQYPEQIQMFDPFGRLPLHISIRSTNWLPELRRRYKPRERYSIENLLREFPTGAKVPHLRRLPLHTAVANGHTWSGGVDVIFRENPDAGLIPDEATSLLPFQLAAIPVGDSKPSLDTIFELLVRQPHTLVLQRRAKKKRTIRQAAHDYLVHGFLERKKTLFPTIVSSYVAFAAVIVGGGVAVLVVT